MKINNKKNGYTIIETMIAVSLFLVITMTGMAALLNANLIQKKSQNLRSIMDNLNFIMEDMSRNIRVGYNYRCYPANTWSEGEAQTPDLNTPQDCASGGVIVFEEAHGHTPSSTISPDPNATDQWAYKIESPDGILPYNIYKSIDGGLTWVQLNPDEVTLDPLSSSFVVTGSDPVPNMEQPYVTIKLVGEITYKNVVTPFTLQTAVSQRIIDI